MNVDDLKGLDEETKKEIEELQKITREKDGDEFFAAAQFNIGNAYFKSNNLKSALEAWNKIENEDNPELYAQLRVDIGVMFKQGDDDERALIEWSKVTRSDSPVAYAYAQFYTGRVLYKLNRSLESIKAYKNIKREDSLELFIEAQFRIAEISLVEGDSKGAINFWSNISRADDPLAYAKAQFSIGAILIEKDIDRKSAIVAWSNIKKTDDPKIFADAQFGIGYELKINNKIDEALIAWSKVKRLDNSAAYAKAQFNTGVTLMELDNFEGALLALKNIKYSDEPEVYKSAQNSIKNIVDNTQFNNELLEKLSNIKRSEEPKAYAQAQYRIGKKLILSSDFGDIISAKVAFENAKDFYPYESYCYSKVCELLVNENTFNIGDKSLDLMELIKKIVNVLTLDFNEDHLKSENNNKNVVVSKSPERKLAHYTSKDTTNKLLNFDSENNLPSSFRLNTVSNFNDPSEGHLLSNYLSYEENEEKEYYAPDFDENLHAFISCFTFNHDSLNQFRSYGKTDNQEASGVSLVFKKEFFQSISKVDTIPFLSNIFNSQSSIHDTSKFETEYSFQEEILKVNEETKKVKKLPVIRCVYIDPTSEYIHLAQRNRLTFFREYGYIKVEHQDISIVEKQRILTISKKSKAEIEWDIYEKYMFNKTEQFKILFIKLKVLYQKIIFDKVKLKNVEKDILNNIETLLDEILVPLKYLIKHSAFQEEQECRVIYITALDNPEVKMTFGKFLYVEYEPDVKSNLDKVYIAPAAKKFQPYIANLLCDKKEVTVETSNNPYRQT